MIARSKAMTLIDEQRPQFIKHHLMFLRFLMCHCPQLYHSYYSARRGLVVVVIFVPFSQSSSLERSGPTHRPNCSRDVGHTKYLAGWAAPPSGSWTCLIP